MPITIAAITWLLGSSRTRLQMSRNPTNVTAPNASDTSVKSADLVDEVGDDLGGVLGVDPSLAGDGEGEEVLRDHLVVIDHPLAGDEVPEDVRVTTSSDDHAEDHDEGGDHDELSGRDAPNAVADRDGHRRGRVLSAAPDAVDTAAVVTNPGAGGAYMMWSTLPPLTPMAVPFVTGIGRAPGVGRCGTSTGFDRLFDRGVREGGGDREPRARRSRRG